ncbi:MAG: TenA family protein [Pseudomonadota bacterium]
MSELYTVDQETALARMIRANDGVWSDFTRHPFVGGLATGTLPQPAFRTYLVQDYLFLVHFARAWALAAFKSHDVEDIRAAAILVRALIDEELQLHVNICAEYGIDEAELQATPEAPANAAYTRFVMERGLAGDLADLLVALAPCVVGYAEIGARLAGDPATHRAGNPYDDWITTYAGESYQDGARTAVLQLERVLRRRLADEPWTSPRWPGLVATFGQATQLEIGFWEIGLAAR